MVGVGDPVRAGLVASLARPGGNITGNTVLSPDLGPKRLQIVREAIPNATRIAYLANPDNASSVATIAEMKVATPAAGMVLISVEVRSVVDFDPAFAAMLRQRPDVVMVTNEPFHQLHIGRIIEFLANKGLPGMFQNKENVAAGGLMAYGPSVPDLFRARRRLRAPNPARDQAGRSAGGAADQVRSRNQSQNRQGARPGVFADIHRPVRRSDRVKRCMRE
jgi:putative tryptophan/tyrosine transport system substrate-binding protein